MEEATGPTAITLTRVIPAFSNHPPTMLVVVERYRQNGYGFLRKRATRFLALYRQVPNWQSAMESSGLVRGVLRTFALRLMAQDPRFRTSAS